MTRNKKVEAIAKRAISRSNKNEDKACIMSIKRLVRGAPSHIGSRLYIGSLVKDTDENVPDSNFLLHLCALY